MSVKLFRHTGFPSSRLPRQKTGAARPAQGLHPAWLLVLACTALTLIGNLPLWQALAHLPQMSAMARLGFGLAMALMLNATLALLLGLLNWRWLLRPLLSVLLLCSALSSHYMLRYNVVIDTPMVLNLLQTNPTEVRDLLSPALLLQVLVLGLLPIWLLWRWPLRRLSWKRQLLSNGLTVLASAAVLVGVMLLSFQTLASVMRNHTQLRYLINPLNTVYALVDMRLQPVASSGPVTPIGQDARLAWPVPGVAPLLVLVLGETARSGNFGLNGYARNTTPELARRPVLSFSQVTSCGTSTAASVPCMFSHLGRVGYDQRRANYENVLDVLQRAGLAVLWIDNQSGCKGVCDRVPQVNTSELTVPGLCHDSECLDEVMLQGLDARIAALPAERRARGVVLVMHQMGSHGPAYARRSPESAKPFQPECRSNALQDCSREEVRNAYDNSIVYTDHFLARLIDSLAARGTTQASALLYLADHGESLGENNLYLHGLPYSIAPDVQKHVPWITWMSPAFARINRLSPDCLKARHGQPLTHDHYFHSILGLVQVRTQDYQPALDAYQACRSAS
jgi:lipid A ethanolaminephosphotransferase